MTTMFIDKLHIKDLEETLANSTALHAVVGAGDLAVEMIRAARGELVTRSASFDPKAFREQAQATFVGRVGALQAEMLTAPEQIRALPEKAQDWPARAQSLFVEVVSTAFSTYGELAGRGKSIVTQVRGERLPVEEVAPVSRPTTSTAKKATPVAKPVAKPAVKKATPVAKPAVRKTTRTNASTLAGQTLAAETGSAKSPAAKTLAAKTSTSTPAAKKLAAKTLASKSAKTPAAKKLAAESTSARKPAAKKTTTAATTSANTRS